MTVQQLRQDGYRVAVEHYRFFGKGREPQHQSFKDAVGIRPNPRGGITIVRLTDETGTTATAYATCSKRDNYSKTIGRNIALGRALKKIREGGDSF